MKKLFINGIVCFTLMLGILSGGVQAKAASINTSSNNQESLQGLTEQSEADRLAAESKVKLSEEYVKTKKHKSKNMLDSAGASKTISKYATEEQQQAPWRDPAAAYNASAGAHTQMQYASDLLTNMYGWTPFPGTWKGVMNTDRPGNNYEALKGANYSDIVDWTNKVRNSIIHTIDKGYPVIADCNITTDTNTRIHSGYSYATNTKHYVVVIGYNDSVSPMKVRIVDSHTSDEIPAVYWTTVDKLSAATKPFGIIWYNIGIIIDILLKNK